MAGWLALGVFLFVLTAVLIVLEIMIPSFGLLSVCAIACFVGGILAFFKFGTGIGWIGVGVGVLVVSLVLILVYKYGSKTKMGKSFLLEPTDKPSGEGIPDKQQLDELVGKEGVVITPLRPVGKCEISGHRVECVAESSFLEKDTKVKVIKIDGCQLTVRQI